jgi:hypothetical protein
MLLYLGSAGAGVGRLEVRLGQLGLYTGNADGVYHGGVESAVKAFQKSRGLDPDGVVGDRTWSELFPGDEADKPSPDNTPLAQRCLALTGTFETSAAAPDCYAGLTGDFDGQGLSFGVLQWNIGQGTLQPLLAEMLAVHEDVMAGLFHDRVGELRSLLASPPAAQLAWARSIQDPLRRRIFEPWMGLFKALGRTPEFQAIEVAHAGDIHRAALRLCARFGLATERAAALMFDIRVQNFSISAATEAKIRDDFAAIAEGTAPLDIEVARLRSIANRRAEAASPAFVEDVRVRKLTIANGEGTVHGVPYHLERQFGIGLRTIPEAEAAEGGMPSAQHVK